MSYAEDPESNPYAAPTSNIEREEYGQPTTGYTGYSGFWRRFAAFFIDGILLGIIGQVIGAVFVAAVGPNNNNQNQVVAMMLLLYVIVIAINVAYYAGMESSSSQATLGKMAMGIKVTDLYGRRISFLRAVGRYFGKIISQIILMIGFIMVAFTEKKQGLHDMMAGTLVLKTR